MSKFDDLNVVIAEGRLIRDPVFKDFQNNNCVCTLTIAINSSYKNKEESYVQEVGFFDIDVWNNPGRACNQYLTKGCKIRVRGALKQNRWESKDGSKKSKIYIKAENVEFKSDGKKDTKDKDDVLQDNIETSLDVNVVPSF